MKNRNNRPKSRKAYILECALSGFLALAAMTALAGAASACDDPLNCPAKMHTVAGGGATIGTSEIKTWAKLNKVNDVKELGVSVPYAIIANPPAPDHVPAGKGDAAMPAMPPHKKICRIQFPEEVRKGTYFEHFEMDWNPVGHEPRVFEVPHFDFHFYAIPAAEVEKIATFDPNPPDAKYMPEGYIYPGAATFVPQMGVHAANPSVLEPPFHAVMLAGFDKGRMHFVEPMITQEFLARKQSFTLEMPRPKELGRKTLYPAKFEAQYDKETDAYRFVFSDFRPMT